MTARRTRREFVQQSALAATGIWRGSEAVAAAGRSANEKLNIAFIGVGGRGGANLAEIAKLGDNVVALCDVDEHNLGRAAEQFPRARKYHDFRKLYDEFKGIDAIVVSTCEHTHSFATLPALQLGRPVYCEKPLCHTIGETRVVREAAARAKVATQMGTQLHASENYRRVVELVQAGAVGAIQECHVWVSRDWGGGDRPQGTVEVPKHLHWDLWLGPAPVRPFHTDYYPGPKWYKYWDFGNGTMPDLGSHWNDLPFWALKLGQPKSVEAEGPPPHPDTAPTWMIVRYEFPARGELPPVKLTWYQGGKRPSLVGEGRVPAWRDGILFVGARGMLLADYSKYKLLPEDQFTGFTSPQPTIPKSLGHHAEWLHACKTGKPTLCPFSYSGVLTESNLLGIVAYRTGKRIEWDPQTMKATNCPEADRFIHKEFRKGWVLQRNT